MNQMNLLPEYYVRQRSRNRVDMLCILLFTLVMTGMIVVGTVQGRKFREAQAEYETVTRRLHDQAGSMDEFLRLRGRKRGLCDEARQVSELEEKIPRSYLTAMVVRSLPDEASLSVLEINEKINITAAMTRSNPRGGRGRKQVTRSNAPAPPAEAPPEKDLIVKIGGYAVNDSDVALFYTTLKALPITQDVQLRHTREYETESGLCREFQIDWELKKNIDALEHLTEDVGVVETAKQPGSAQGREAG